MKNFIFLFLLAILYNTNLFAQKILTINDAVAIALEKSFTIQSSKHTLLSAQNSFDAVRMGFRSSINLEFDLPRYSRTLSSQFNPLLGSDQFFSVGNTTFEGRLRVNQPLLFSNGTLAITGSIFGRDQFNVSSSSSRDYFSNLSIQLRQPLFSFNSQLASLRRSEISFEKMKRNYTQAERDLIFNVTSSYLNLYKTKKSLEITEEKVKQTEESYSTAMSKYKAGLIAEVDALQLEVDYASSKNELLNSRQMFEEAKNEFKILIGLGLNEDFDINIQLDYTPIILDNESITKKALENRIDLLNAEFELELNRITIDEINSLNSIKVEVNASYGLNKNDDLLANIFKHFGESRSVTITVSVPVFDWGKNSLSADAAATNLKIAELSKENLKKQITKEILSAVNKINSAKARVEILNKSVDIAEKSYSISVERFKTGNVTSFNLSQIQLKLTDTKLNSLNAVIDYYIAIADLERKSFAKIAH